jgi:hypothetical protein
MKKLLSVLGILAVLAVAIQFIPVARTNPPLQGPFVGPPEMMNPLKSACYDCHSHDTVWPWYSRIAPASWLVAHDVKEGREHLNFSAWGQYDRAKQKALLRMAMDEVEEREMPPKPYLWMHAEARLTDAQVEDLVSWFEKAAAD